jgi:hypothetical protein
MTSGATAGAGSTAGADGVPASEVGTSLGCVTAGAAVVVVVGATVVVVVASAAV